MRLQDEVRTKSEDISDEVMSEVTRALRRRVRKTIEPMMIGIPVMRPGVVLHSCLTEETWCENPSQCHCGSDIGSGDFSRLVGKHPAQSRESKPVEPADRAQLRCLQTRHSGTGRQ